MRAAHKYAKDHYTLGLPTGKTARIAGIINDHVDPIIASDINHPDGVVTLGFFYAPNYFRKDGPGL